MATIVIGRLRVSPKSEHPEYEIEFQKSIYQMQRISEDLAQRTAAENGCELIICDRGLHDGAAYMPDGLLTYSMLFGPYPQDYTRYAGVICLGPPPRSVYEAVCGNNSARSETYEQAVALGSKTLDAWRFHRGLHLIDAGTPSHSWEDKRNAVIEVIEKYLRKS